MDEYWLMAQKALIEAIKVEVEGMIAENQFKYNTQNYIPYGEESFQEKAQELYSIYDTIMKNR